MKGVPYYCKIDIEGSEVQLLRSMTNRAMLPEYISVECHPYFDPIESLYECGYRQFRLVHQALHNSIRPPYPPLEGQYVEGHRFAHASGYFGKELPGRRWMTFREVVVAFDAILRLRSFEALHGIWFDCHAWL